MTKIAIYAISINILSILLMGWDKHCAKKNYWRISENTLLGISLLGGAIGTFLGMILFHHKTKKKKFQIIVPLSIVWNIYLFYNCL